MVAILELALLRPHAKLEVAGNVKIADGTQGAGKVLTSDANGLATWQASTATWLKQILKWVPCQTIKFQDGMEHH
jgi:hypothetical protein